MNPTDQKKSNERSYHGSPQKSYISSIYGGEEKILQNVKKSIEEKGLRKINIDEYEGRMLEFLITLCNARKIVEIGTLAGYSTIWLARALPEGGKIYTFESEKNAYDIAKANFEEYKNRNKIELIFGNAHEKLSDIEDKGPFDATFIDAEKRGYPKYLDWAENNIRKDGLIIADNTFLKGAVYDDNLLNEKNEKQVAAMKEFNRRLADKNKYSSIILPTEEGLSVAKKLF